MCEGFFFVPYISIFSLCACLWCYGGLSLLGLTHVPDAVKHRDTLFQVQNLSSVLLLLNLCYSDTRRQYLYQERGCASIRVCVCACLPAALWQRGASWPADFLPSEIASEDYKTNQQAVIAAASLWLDHNPAAHHQLFKGKEREGRRIKQTEMRKVIKRDVRGRRRRGIRGGDGETQSARILPSHRYSHTTSWRCATNFCLMRSCSLLSSLFLVGSSVIINLYLTMRWTYISPSLILCSLYL